MPAKPEWLLHIPRICDELERLSVPVVDRAIIEKAFGLKRRQAIDAMHGFGGYRIGRTFLVDRLHLLGELRRIEQTAEFRSEWQRKERLSDQLDQIRRCRKAAQVVVLVNPEVRERRIAGLSNGINLGPSELRIVFEDAEDLVRKLVELSQAAANDFETFQSVAEGYAG